MTTGRKAMLTCTAAILLAAGWSITALAFSKLPVGEEVPNARLQSLSGTQKSVLNPEAPVNLFLFFRPNQEYSKEALSILTRVCGQYARRKIHCTAIVSDYYSKSSVTTALRHARWDGDRTLIDKEDLYYWKLGVRLHPCFGIAGKDRILSAYEPYVSTNFQQRIEAHVKYAFGDINVRQLIRLLNPLPVQEVDDASRSWPHLQLARYLLKEGKLDRAIEQAKLAIQLNANLAAAHEVLGTIYLTQNRCDLAKPQFEKALTLDPRDKEALQGKSKCK